MPPVLRVPARPPRDPLTEITELAELALGGALDLAGVATRVEPLEGAPEALERLRTGDGVRTVIAVDADLAGRAPGSEPR